MVEIMKCDKCGKDINCKYNLELSFIDDYVHKDLCKGCATKLKKWLSNNKTKKMDRILIMGIEILIDKDCNNIIIHREDLEALKSLGESQLMNLATQFDEDFYTNDGYSLDITDDEFSYSYDDGSKEVDIYLF